MQDASDNPFTDIDPTSGRPIITIPRSSGGGTADQGPVQAGQANAPAPTEGQTPASGGPSGTPPGPSAEDQAVIDKYDAMLKGTPQEPNAFPATPPVSSNDTTPTEAPGVGTVGMDTPEDAENARKAIIRSNLANNKDLGGLGDFAASFNEDTLQGIATTLRGAAAVGMGEATALGPTALGDQGKTFARNLERVGMDWLQSNEPYVPAQKLFDALGVAHYHNDTYMDDAGHSVWSTIATSAALAFGLPAWVARQELIYGAGGTNAKSIPLTQALNMAIRKYSDAMAANPGMWVASEHLGGAGATVGGEEAMDRARVSGAGPVAQGALGSVGGAVGGAVSGAWLTGKVGSNSIRISKALARGVVRTADGLIHLFGGNRLPLPDPARDFIGIRRPSPIVPQEVVDAAREAETKARDAGDMVVQARKYLDKQRPGTSEHGDAKLMMQAAQDTEENAVREAEKAWNMVPIEARGRFSRQQLALRDKFADTMYPREFAQDQVQSMQNLIQSGLDAAMDKLLPEDLSSGLMVQSAKLNKDLWEIRRVGKGVLGKYWKKANLQRVFPKGNGVVSDLDGFIKRVTGPEGYNPDQLPMAEFDELRDKFGPIKNPPTNLAWMKSFMSKLLIRSDQAYASGDYIKAGAYDKFHAMLYDTMARNFPDDIGMQQAKAESKQFLELFTKSSLGQIFAASRKGIPDVRAEDTLKTLMNSAHGFNDMQKAVTWLASKTGAVNIKSPDYMTKQARATLQQITPDAEQAIRANFQEMIEKAERDPNKVARIMGNPAIQRQLASIGKISATMRQASQDLNKLLTQRKTIEQSALAKYMQKDPDVAIDNVWNGVGGNPSEVAQALMDGTAGVGGFRQDPMAMQGFKAGLLDRLYRSTKGDPTALKEMLAGKRGRVLKTVLSGSEWDRLNGIVDRLGVIADQAAHDAEKRHGMIVLGQMVSLKVLHHVSEWVPLMHVGEGGSLQRAALVSSFTKDYLESVTKSVPPEQMFYAAITDPAYEQALYSRLPGNGADAKEMVSTMRRMVGFERGILGFYRNWAAYGDGPGESAPQAQGGAPYSWLDDFVRPANAAEVLQGPMPQTPSRFLNAMGPGAQGEMSIIRNWDRNPNYNPPINMTPGPLYKDRRSENEGREIPPLYRGGQNVAKPPVKPVKETPEGGPRGIYSELTDENSKETRSRAEFQRNYKRFEDNRKSTPSTLMPGVIGPGDRVPDRERGQGPGKRRIIVS